MDQIMNAHVIIITRLVILGLTKQSLSKGNPGQILKFSRFLTLLTYFSFLYMISRFFQRLLPNNLLESLSSSLVLPIEIEQRNPQFLWTLILTFTLYVFVIKHKTHFILITFYHVYPIPWVWACFPNDMIQYNSIAEPHVFHNFIW